MSANENIASLTMSRIAKAALEEFDNPEDATNSAFAAIKADNELYDMLCDGLLMQAVQTAVRDCRYANRVAAWNMKETTQSTALRKSIESCKSVQIAAKATEALLMEMFLSKGRLGDYTSEMLEEEALLYLKEADTKRKRGGWLMKLSKMVPRGTGQKAREVLDEQALQALAV